MFSRKIKKKLRRDFFQIQVILAHFLNLKFLIENSEVNFDCIEKILGGKLVMFPWAGTSYVRSYTIFRRFIRNTYKNAGFLDDSSTCTYKSYDCHRTIYTSAKISTKHAKNYTQCQTGSQNLSNRIRGTRSKLRIIVRFWDILRPYETYDHQDFL